MILLPPWCSSHADIDRSQFMRHLGRHELSLMAVWERIWKENKVMLQGLQCERDAPKIVTIDFQWLSSNEAANVFFKLLLEDKYRGWAQWIKHLEFPVGQPFPRNPSLLVPSPIQPAAERPHWEEFARDTRSHYLEPPSNQAAGPSNAGPRPSSSGDGMDVDMDPPANDDPPASDDAPASDDPSDGNDAPAGDDVDAGMDVDGPPAGPNPEAAPAPTRKRKSKNPGDEAYRGKSGSTKKSKYKSKDFIEDSDSDTPEEVAMERLPSFINSIAKLDNFQPLPEGDRTTFPRIIARNKATVATGIIRMSHTKRSGLLTLCGDKSVREVTPHGLMHIAEATAVIASNSEIVNALSTPVGRDHMYHAMVTAANTINKAKGYGASFTPDADKVAHQELFGIDEDQHNTKANYRDTFVSKYLSELNGDLMRALDREGEEEGEEEGEQDREEEEVQVQEDDAMVDDDRSTGSATDTE